MPDYIQQLRCHLAELGCPPARLNRMAREVADHREDLIEAARAEKMFTPEATARADAKLGDPILLAGELMRTFRRSNWWGRNYLFTFGFLPLLACPVLWALFLIAGLSLAFAIGFGWDHKKLHVIGNDPVVFHHWAMMAQRIDGLAIGLVAFLICWLARRSGVSIAWMFIACFVCSVYAIVSYTYLGRHSFNWGLAPYAQWHRASIPVFVATAFYLRHRWTIHFCRWRSAI